MSDHHWAFTLRCILCTALLWAVGAAGFFIARPALANEEPLPEEYLYQVLMPPFLIADGVTVYQLESRYYLPLNVLAEGFEFFIESDPARGYASGWYITEENSFVIDAGRGEYIVRGEKHDLADDQILRGGDIDPSDIYVQIELLNEIWPVDMQPDVSELIIEVESDGDEKLPFQERLERKKKQEIKLARQKVAETKVPPDLVWAENGYQWLGKPAVDLQSSFAFDNSTKELTGNGSITGTQQFAKAVADYSASFNYDEEGKIRKPNNIRLKLWKQAFPGEDLGFDINRAEAGDVNIRQRALISNGVGGRGVTVTSARNLGRQEFDSITVEGTAPPGWEIELYNNNELITFGVVEADGEYRFENVTLRFGKNRIRVVLYGPQGQVREIVETYNFGGGMLSPGDFEYTAGLVDAGRPLLLLENDPRNTPRGAAYTAHSSYGLNRNVTLFGSTTRLPTALRGDMSYMTGGAIFSAFNSIGSVELYNELGGGRAVDTRFLTDIKGFKFNIRNSFFTDFESPDTGFDQNAKEFEAEYQVNKSFNTKFGALGLQLRALQRENKDGNVFLDFGTQQSLSRGGLRISNSTLTESINEIHQHSTGRINATVRVNRMDLRGGLSYELHPKKQFAAGQAEIRYKSPDGLYGSVAVRHDLITTKSGIGMDAGYDFGKFLGTVETDYEEDRGWRFGVRASASLNPYTNDRGYDFVSKSMRNASPVRARVFLDRDADGAFTEGTDEPLEDARIRVNSGISRTGADENGYLVHTGGGAAIDAVVTVEEASLIDPYYKPAFDGYATRLLPGTMPTLDFPIIETGAVDGTIYYPDDLPIPGITVELVDASGKVVNKMETSFDGFYSFEFVKPGTYTVRVDPSHGVNVPPETVTVDPKDLFLYGIDLQLVEQAGDQAAEPVPFGPELPGPDGESVGGIAQNPPHAQAAAGTGKPAPTSGEGGYAAIVKKVRIGEHPDKIRFVMDLSEPIRFEIRPEEGGRQLVIDMPGVAWDAMKHWRAGGASARGVEKYETEALAEGGTRLRIYGGEALHVMQSGLVSPEGGYGDRLFIDLAK